jgi:hypothetical protein
MNNDSFPSTPPILNEDYFRQNAPLRVRTSRPLLLTTYNAIIYQQNWITGILNRINHTVIDPMTFSMRYIYFNYELLSLTTLLSNYSPENMPLDLLFVLRRIFIHLQRRFIKSLEKFPLQHGHQFTLIRS